MADDQPEEETCGAAPQVECAGQPENNQPEKEDQDSIPGGGGTRTDQSDHPILRRQDPGSKDIYGRLMTFFALLVSVIALVFSISQGRANRLHNQLSMRPFLQIHCIKGRVPTVDWPYVGLYVSNYGPGIAIIDSVEVSLDGVALPDSDDIFTDLLQSQILTNLPGSPWVRHRLPSAVAPGEEYILLGIPKDQCTDEMLTVWKDTLDRTSVRISYHSLYDVQYLVHTIEAVD